MKNGFKSMGNAMKRAIKRRCNTERVFMRSVVTRCRSSTSSNRGLPQAKVA